MAIGSLLVALLSWLVGPGAGEAVGQQGEGSPPGQLRLVDQTATVPADGVFVVRFGLPDSTDGGSGVLSVLAAVAGLDVAVIVHGRIDDPAALDDEPPEPINRLPVRALSSLGVDADGAVTVRVPIRPGPPFDGIERVLIPEPGVYPVTVELRDDGAVRSSLRTTLIRLPEPGVEQPEGDSPVEGDPVPSVAVVLTVTGPDAVAEESGADEMTSEGADGVAAELAAATGLLVDHGEVPMTVVLGADHLAALQQDPALAAAFRTAVGDRPVVPIPRPTLDPSALAAIDQGGLYTSSLEGARSAVAALGLAPATTTAAVGGRQTTGGARLLIESGTTSAFDLSSRVQTGGLVASGRLATTAGALTVIAADEWPVLAGVAAAGGTPAERVQQLVSRLFLAEGSRPVVVSEGHGGTDRMAVMGLVLNAIAAASIEVVPLTDVEASLDELDRLTPAPSPVDDLAPVAGKVLEAQDLLASYDTFYGDGEPTPESFRNEITASLATGRDPESRLRTIDDLIARLQAELSVISLPGNQSVTLAARSVSIPLTIDNRSSGSRQVMLQFRSDKIVVAEQGQLITIEPGTSSIDVLVETRSLGVSPLQVSVLSPDGRHTLSTTRFQVRSTAVPGLGLLISAVGLGLLALWWSLHIRRRRSTHPSRPGPPSPTDPPSEDGVVDRDRALAGDSV